MKSIDAQREPVVTREGLAEVTVAIDNDAVPAPIPRLKLFDIMGPVTAPA